MKSQNLVETIKSFSDNPNDVSYEGGRVVGEIHDEIFEIELNKRRGDLKCIEDGREYSAWEWITKRLGRFDLLARRILDYVPEDELFVSVGADVMNVLDKDPDEEKKYTSNALKSVKNLLDDPLDVTKVVYLTSDAGEGKTSLIDRITRAQAELYLEGETDWLMLPVKLGGRPFIRLDDVIVGTLSNRLRFPYYFYESVIELVKHDALVLALDGFEEMLVETKTGDAVSSLGNLVNRFESSGSLLVAARSAYYEYRDFETQAQLFQSIRQSDVSFAEVALRRWSKEQFISLATKAGVEEEGEKIFNTISDRLSEEHALLTRAVLARKLVEEYIETEDKDSLLQELSQATGEEYFDQFVSRLVRREANEKWIDSSGEAAQPLLSVDEHHRVLASVAEEMWLSGANSVNSETLEDLTSLVASEEFKKQPKVVRQCKERITNHALLVRTPGTDLYQFDHEDFRNYYLGRYLAELIKEERLSEVRTMMEINVFPLMVKRTCVNTIKSKSDNNEDIYSNIRKICNTAQSGQTASFLKANAGKISISLLEGLDMDEIFELKNIYTESDEIENASLKNICFKKCTVERAGLKDGLHKNIKFEGSDVYHLIIWEGNDYSSITFDPGSMPSKLTVVKDGDVKDIEDHFYEPPSIKATMKKYNFDLEFLEEEEEDEVDVVEDIDLEVQIVDRVLRYYQRSTSLNENVFKKRLGTWWPRFEERVLPDLLDYGVLREVPYSGGGNQRRFRLSATFEEVENARRKSRGSYERLLDALH